MNLIPIRKIALALGGLISLSGCSASFERVSADKEHIDQQKDIQRTLIDERTSELNRDLEIQTMKSKNLIETQKAELNAQIKALNDEEQEIERDAALSRKNLEIQSRACKARVDMNAKNLKASLDARFNPGR
ncbi:MAG: hypothetical protein K2X27_11640 [Candidatus Obscuribacterales bacterium]|nr:hypothetical protein [Candidatus Obscuribacterales bacterium]